MTAAAAAIVAEVDWRRLSVQGRPDWGRASYDSSTPAHARPDRQTDGQIDARTHKRTREACHASPNALPAAVLLALSPSCRYRNVMSTLFADRMMTLDIGLSIWKLWACGVIYWTLCPLGCNWLFYMLFLYLLF